MSAKFKVSETKEDSIFKDERQAFMHEVLIGLSKTNKSINSKYFYDKKGSELFNKITHHPAYYLTNCELEILDFYKEELATLFKNVRLNLIELGPGEGIKTRLLIDQFLSEKVEFSYYPIDISKNYLSQIINKFNQQLPRLETLALNSDYLTGIKWLSKHSTQRNLVLFLGSSIGNFSLHDAKEFLSLLHHFLHPGDYLLIGFDLLKKTDILLEAYNDPAGLTRDFNLNLLRRMNKELGANFNINSFDHYGTYNVHSKAMESYLISNKSQIVYMDALKKSFNFKEFEAVQTESSQKYSVSDVNKLARKTRFKPIRHFTDSRQFFLNSLWQV